MTNQENRQEWPTREELVDLLGIVMLGQYMITAGMYHPTSGRDASKVRDSLGYWEEQLKMRIAESAAQDVMEGK